MCIVREWDWPWAVGMRDKQKDTRNLAVVIKYSNLGNLSFLTRSVGNGVGPVVGLRVGCIEARIWHQNIMSVTHAHSTVSPGTT